MPAGGQWFRASRGADSLELASAGMGVTVDQALIIADDWQTPSGGDALMAGLRYHCDALRRIRPALRPLLFADWAPFADKSLPRLCVSFLPTYHTDHYSRGHWSNPASCS